MKSRIRQDILCVTNKPSSLREAADELNAYFEKTLPNMRYKAVVDLDHNKIDIYQGDRLISEHYLSSEDTVVNGYRFRKATDEDIDKGVQLYVKEKYKRNTKKQVVHRSEIREIFQKFDLE